MTPPPVTHAPSLVIEELLERCMGSSRVAALLLETFEAHAPENIRALESALAAGDGQAAARIAHALKGAAGTIAAHDLWHQAAGLEASARAGRLDDAARSLAALREQCARCMGYLPSARAILQQAAGAAPGSCPATPYTASPDTTPRPEVRP